MRIIQRSAWGARHADGFGPAPLPFRDWFLHHSVTAVPAPTQAAEAQAMRQLEQIGQERFQGGISYTFAVMPSGRVYEGHGIGRRGAHTKGHNTTARGIVLVGDYSRMHPTEQQLDAVARVLVWAHRQGLCSPATLTGGHRDVKQTECPGVHAYAAIREINRRAGALLRQAPSHRPPGGQPDTTPPEDDMPKLDDVIDLGKGQAAVLGEADSQVTVEQAMAIQTAALVEIQRGQERLIAAVDGLAAALRDRP